MTAPFINIPVRSHKFAIAFLSGRPNLKRKKIREGDIFSLYLVIREMQDTSFQTSHQPSWVSKAFILIKYKKIRQGQVKTVR